MKQYQLCVRPAGSHRIRNWFLGLSIAIGMVFCFSSTSEAHWWRPYHNNVLVSGGSVGWGYYAWPVVIGSTYSIGYSYWGHWNYQPHYSGYGAIAYSSDTGRVGFSYGLGSRRAAEREAIGYCGEEGCKSVIWVQGGCAALVRSRGIL